jgi:hypothetical protein
MSQRVGRSATRIVGITPLALLLIGCAPAGDERAPAEQTTQRIPQLENEHVDVWKSVIVPHQPLTMHRHDNPRVIIALQGGPSP